MTLEVVLISMRDGNTRLINRGWQINLYKVIPIGVKITAASIMVGGPIYPGC